MAPQSMGTRGRPWRPLSSWRARATSSLPTPVSPWTSTVKFEAATCRIRRTTLCMPALPPSSDPSALPPPTLRRRLSICCSSSERSSARCTMTISSSVLTGLVRNWYAPSWIACTAMRTSAKPVSTMTGSSGRDHLEPLEHLQPADARQPQVQHDDVGRIARHLLQGRRPVVDDGHPQAGRVPEQCRQDAPLHRIVVDGQQPAPGLRQGQRRGRVGGLGLSRRPAVYSAPDSYPRLPYRFIARVTPRRYTMGLRQATGRDCP